MDSAPFGTHDAAARGRRAGVPATVGDRDYQLGPAIVLEFDNLDDGYLGWWDPAAQRLMVHRGLRGRELAETVLHEIGHMLCGDHGDVTPDAGDEHLRLDEWATQAASLLELARPGRRAAPA